MLTEPIIPPPNAFLTARHPSLETLSTFEPTSETMILNTSKRLLGKRAKLRSIRKLVQLMTDIVIFQSLLAMKEEEEEGLRVLDVDEAKRVVVLEQQVSSETLVEERVETPVENNMKDMNSDNMPLLLKKKNGGKIKGIRSWVKKAFQRKRSDAQSL